MADKGLLSYDTLVHAVAGATGSVVGMATFYPLDTVRCRLQLEETVENGAVASTSANGNHTNGYMNGNSHNGNGVHTNGNGTHANGNDAHTNGNGVHTNGKHHANGIGIVRINGTTALSANDHAPVKYSGILGEGTLRMLRKIFAKEGLPGLYKGVVPVLQSLCASNFVYFYTFHGLRAAWGGRALNGVRTQSAARDLLLAAVAGTVNVLVTTPLWVVNTRLKMSGTPYDNLLSGLKHVIKEEGLQGLWAGTAPSLLLVANPALQFMVYESLKRRLGRQMSALTSLLVGATAKAFATIITYPLQVAQARLRHRGTKAEGDGAALPLLLALIKQRGLLGLFRGLEAKLLQTVLTAALMFATYEKIARFVFSLMHRNRKILMKH